MSVYRPTHRCNLLNTSVELIGYEIEFRVPDIRKAFIGKTDFCPLIAILCLSISCKSGLHRVSDFRNFSLIMILAYNNLSISSGVKSHRFYQGIRITHNWVRI
jgi:hypothetical protein